MKGLLKRAYTTESGSKKEESDDGVSVSTKALGAGALAVGGGVAQDTATIPMSIQKSNPKTDIGGLSKKNLESQISESVQHTSNDRMGFSDFYGAVEKRGPHGDEFREAMKGQDWFNPDVDAHVVAPGDDTDLSFYAHELGHAKGSKDPSSFRKFLDRSYDFSTGPTGWAIGGGLGSLAATSQNDTARKLAPAAAVAPLVPGLIEEGRANLNADKIMRDAGLSGSELWEGRKGLLKSFGGYLGAAGGLGAGAYGLSKLMDKRYEDEEDEGNS